MTTDAIRCPEAIATLERIGSKPGTTHRDLLTITRRIVHHLSGLYRIISAERRVISRQANVLRYSSPFNHWRADALEQQARDHRADELANVVDALEDYGCVLVLDREGYAKGLGFEALAELLNINRVDRARARRKGWFYLTDLVAIEGLENSAERRSHDWEFRHSPLQLACVLGMGLMLACSPDQLPEPRTVRPVRKRPTLVVHESSGSHVVER